MITELWISASHNPYVMITVIKILKKMEKNLDDREEIKIDKNFRKPHLNLKPKLNKKKNSK